jgi:hypothetical protein
VQRRACICRRVLILMTQMRMGFSIPLLRRSLPQLSNHSVLKLAHAKGVHRLCRASQRLQEPDCHNRRCCGLRIHTRNIRPRRFHRAVRTHEKLPVSNASHSHSQSLTSLTRFPPTHTNILIFQTTPRQNVTGPETIRQTLRAHLRTRFHTL